VTRGAGSAATTPARRGRTARTALRGAPGPAASARSRARDGERRGSPSGAYARIYAVVRRVPRGRVATYGQVAAAAGFAHAPRLAGYALYALPEGTPLPWHRVVGAEGRLSLARLSPDGALTQRMRLEREGVAFDARGRVVMRDWGWGPPAKAGRASSRRKNAREARPRRC
jgi:methylated-DNA-protein-cysteine methyltransferase-like protein